jgi:hypothetical protein
MTEATHAAETAAQEQTQETQTNGKQSRTWYPYITKVQFEKFLSRLESKIPERIDRDYVRAIIRTPSMIYRFLRGIEAMKLIDRDQQTGERLRRLVAAETRRQTIAEILRDLYKDLMDKWEKTGGQMGDDEVVEFFRSRTGMGRDSANKMKMFFKYLIGEAELGAASEPASRGPAAPRFQEVEPERRPGREVRSSPPAPPAQPSRHPNGPQQLPAAQQQQQYERLPRNLTEAQKSYLEAIQSIVKVNVDGDWDEDMIRVAFDRLERLLDRVRRI